MTPFTAVILAAGQGTRMRSATPKVLHPLCGRPLVLWPVLAAREAGASDVVVVGGPDRALEDVLPEDVALAVQEVPDGTGGAVRAAAGQISRDRPVVVLAGDVPLVTTGAIRELVDAHASAGAAATMATMVLEDPDDYGRVVRAADGTVERVVETKKPGDATPEQLAIREVNTGVFAFDGGALVDALGSLRSDNAQGELYLPDVLPALRAAGRTVAAHVVDDPTLTLGVNDRADLARVARLARERINREHMLNGVTMVDPASTYVDAGVEIGRDTVLEPGTALRGATRIGEGCTIGPHATLTDVTLGDGVTVRHSWLEGCEARDGVTIGPFAYLRPKTVLREGSKAGTFVEIKNSDIGEGTKVPHLSYIGDAHVGDHTNLGASTITANYDGRHKHPTTIGRNVHGGVHVSLVAPVTVGDDAYTAAGSVITDEVPSKALGIARERQTNIEGYADREGE